MVRASRCSAVAVAAEWVSVAPPRTSTLAKAWLPSIVAVTPSTSRFWPSIEVSVSPTARGVAYSRAEYTSLGSPGMPLWSWSRALPFVSRTFVPMTREYAASPVWPVLSSS
jgi:hypothetical protein